MAARLRREDGVEGLEVALVGALIVIVLLVAVPTLSAGIGNTIEAVATAIQSAGDGTD